MTLRRQLGPGITLAAVLEARPQWPKHNPVIDEIPDFTNDGPLVTKTPRRAAMDVLADIAQWYQDSDEGLIP